MRQLITSLLLNNKNKISRSSGFTLIELLVVVAIIGILAGVGIVAYTGYIDTTKRKSAENALMQLALGQTEYYSDNSEYYGTGAGSTCSPSSTSTTGVLTALVDGADLFSEEVGYNVCAVTNTTSLYFLVAKETNGTCKITFNGSKGSIVSRDNC
mgnify:FL=1